MKTSNRNRKHVGNVMDRESEAIAEIVQSSSIGPSIDFGTLMVTTNPDGWIQHYADEGYVNEIIPSWRPQRSPRPAAVRC
jgi:hypothetical protein